MDAGSRGRRWSDGAVQIDDTGAMQNTIKSRFREELYAEFVELLRAERARNDEVQARLAQQVAALQARLDAIEMQRSDACAAAVAPAPAPAPAEAEAPAFVPVPSPPVLDEAEAPAFVLMPVPSPDFPAPAPAEAGAPVSAPPLLQRRRLECDERRLVERVAEAPVPSPADTTGADAPARDPLGKFGIQAATTGLPRAVP